MFPMKVIRPNWPAPEGVIAFSTTRVGGFSKGVYEGLNIAHHVGDAEEVVAQNRKILSSELPPQCSVAWLTQEHGARVVVAAENPDVVSSLRRSLESWESTHPDPIWRIDDAWHARTLERYDQAVVDGFVRN